jgi:hypothetical protein
MPLPKSSTIWLRESSPALRALTSAVACDHGADRGRSRAPSPNSSPRAGNPTFHSGSNSRNLHGPCSARVPTMGLIPVSCGARDVARLSSRHGGEERGKNAKKTSTRQSQNVTLNQQHRARWGATSKARMSFRINKRGATSSVRKRWFLTEMCSKSTKVDSRQLAASDK